jgi:DNA-directed RNA polymerase specialized sigma24 family protein
MNFVHIAHPQPFWFVESDLSADLLRAEIAKVKAIRNKHGRLEGFLDSPEATASQRKLCFVVLAHGKVLEIVSELFASRYEPAPRISEEDSKILNWMDGLAASDAPDWVLETNRVVDRLSVHLKNALPEPLWAESYATNDPVQMKAIESAVKTLNTLENLQSLIERVVDQQFNRLLQRWAPKPKKPKHWLKGTQGLRKKHDFSGYSHHLTDKQQLAFSLKWEYELGLSELASRMGITRKTASEHIHAAKRNIDRGISNEKRRLASSKNTDS